MILFLIRVVIVVGLEAKKEKSQKVASVIVMNDFVLRGFCQKCFCVLEKSTYGKGYSMWGQPLLFQNEKECEITKHEPVWFLSRRQITLLCYSKEYKEFCKKMNGDWSLIINFENWINLMLGTNPFLVAKILSDAGKDS